VGAGTFDDHFPRQFLKILNLWKRFYPHNLTRNIFVSDLCFITKNEDLT
jgi:hypothetical protein